MADGDLYLSDSPNVDKGFVEQDGQLRGVKLQAVPDGTLELLNSANVSTGYVTDTDGKKHKVNLVAEVEGTLELPDAPNADTGYVVDGDGKKHKVQLSATLYGGGSTPVIEELNVTPSTSAQTITAPEGTDGYSPVNVAAVTSSIDANIIAGNIKNGVEILGVTGNYSGSAPTYYIEKLVDENGVLNPGTGFINLTGVKSLGAYIFYYGFYGVSFSDKDIDMSNILYASGDYCLNMAFSVSNIKTLDLSSLTSITGAYAAQSMCSFATSLTSVNLSSLKTTTGSNCLQQAFYRTALTSISFPALKSPGVNNNWQNLLRQVSNCTVHFPSNMQSVMGSWSNVTGGFGGTGTTVLYDLPATVVLTGADNVAYERNPKFDTGSALSWRVNNSEVTSTAYYTSGTTDPSVGDTIYSDAACTQAVTTISSIA